MASIRDDLERWLTAGISGLERDDALLGTLRASGGSADEATLRLSDVAGFDPSDTGFPEQAEATWTADAGDNVAIGAALSFNPAALLAALALAPARLEVPGAESLAEALAEHDDRCDGVSAALIENGQAPAESCLKCDANCTRLLCGRGLERLVERAVAATLETPAELRLAASGRAEVGQEAELQSLDGSWVGELELEDDSAALGGALEATGAY